MLVNTYIFPYRYTVYDLKSDRMYQLSLNISLCLETSNPCLLETVVFRNVFLPKKPCSLTPGFVLRSMLFFIKEELFLYD